MSRRPVTLQDLFDGLQALTAKVDTLTERVDTLTERVDTLTERVDTLTKRVDDLADGQQTLAAKVDNMSVELKSVRYTGDNLVAGYLTFRSDFKELRDITNAGFETLGGRFDRLEERVEHLEPAAA